MHMLIYVLVDAPDRDSALTASQLVFDRLVGRDPTASAVFDYYVTLDETDRSGVGGDRYTDRPSVARTDSDDLPRRGYEARSQIVYGAER